MRYTMYVLVLTGLCLILAACQPQEPPSDDMIVYVESDGVELTFQIDEPTTVEQFLDDVIEATEIEYDDNDRLNPPPYTQLTDGMRVTIVQIDQETVCEREEIPYTSETQFRELLDPGEEFLVRAGENGVQEVCYRITNTDGTQTDRTQVGQPEIIKEPVAEVKMVGMSQDVEPISIAGTLGYINYGDAWVISGTSTSRRPLTTSGSLDGLAFALSSDGQYILFTQEPADETAFVNELWFMSTGENSNALQLTPTDVLYAQWVPNQADTISYTTSEVQDISPYWKALNNLWTMRIDPNTGDSLNIRQIVPESSGGLYGWWGTVFEWSPDGEEVGWVRADSAGILNEDGELQPIVEYENLRTFDNWSWRANFSWSWSADQFITTVHGPPLGSEPRDTSPVFNVVSADVNDSYEAKLVDSAGMWASPKFSPPVDTGGEFQDGHLAYLKARRPYNSVNGEYDLVVADRDGSNARVIFPDPDQPGITSDLTGLIPHDFTWSPDGTQIAVIYQGDLWVVDVETGVRHQLTFDGGSSFPVWSS